MHPKYEIIFGALIELLFSFLKFSIAYIDKRELFEEILKNQVDEIFQLLLADGYLLMNSPSPTSCIIVTKLYPFKALIF